MPGFWRLEAQPDNMKKYSFHVLTDMLVWISSHLFVLTLLLWWTNKLATLVSNQHFLHFYDRSLSGANVFQSAGDHWRLLGPGQWGGRGVPTETSQQIPAVDWTSVPGSLPHLHGKTPVRFMDYISVDKTCGFMKNLLILDVKKTTFGHLLLILLIHEIIVAAVVSVGQVDITDLLLT